MLVGKTVVATRQGKGGVIRAGRSGVIRDVGGVCRARQDF